LVELNIEALKKLMKEQNLSESKFAKKIGVTRSCVNRILKGERQPSFKFISGLIFAFPQHHIEQFFLKRPSPKSDTLKGEDRQILL